MPKQIDQFFTTKLLEIDVNIINTAFMISKEAGEAAMHNAIYGFCEILSKDIGSFMGGMNLEYRSYITGLLSGIESQFLPTATKIILFPKPKKKF
jgi:hypothetical protein